MMERAFDRIARWLGRAGVGFAFIVALVVAMALGPLFHWSEKYMLVLTLFMSGPPYVVGFIIAYSQARDTAAQQVQQAELIRALPGARNELIGLEAKTTAEIEEVRTKLVEEGG